MCGSDLGIYHSSIRIPIRPPVVMGHEFSGIVMEKGYRVREDISVGDRVTAEPSYSICGTCKYCRSEHYNLCSQRRILGYTADGCFARFCDATFVHRVPDNISFEAASITELVACCVHCVIEQTGVSAGDFVVVTGPGPLGMLAAMVAQAEGGVVTMCGTSVDENRLQIARDLGIFKTVNVEEGDAAAEIKGLTEGYGADVVLECSGSQSAARLGLEVVRKRGKYTQMGLFGKRVSIDFEKIAFKEIEVRGGVSHRRPSWKRALGLMERGSVDTEPLITHTLPLAKWKTAFDMLEKKECLKAVLVP